MPAWICDVDDHASLELFAAVLREFCAVQLREGRGVDVTVREYRIGDQTINVFSDSWCLDIDGPDAIVKGIVEAMRLKREAKQPARG